MTTPKTRTFRLFPTLPLDLRNSIWEAALPSSRFVTISDKPTHHLHELKHTPEYDSYIALAAQALLSLGSPPDSNSRPPEQCATILSSILGPSCGKEILLRCFDAAWTHRDRDEHITDAIASLSPSELTTLSSKPYTKSVGLLYLVGRQAIFESTRESHISSPLPIPTLLHTTHESRAAMLRCGYKLMFGTPTHGARVWFCGKRDTLYLSPSIWNRNQDAGLSNRERGWNINLLLSEDVRRVERVALRAARHMDMSCLSTAISRMSGLKVLFWVVSQVEQDPYTRDANTLDYTRNNNKFGMEWGFLECDTVEYTDSRILGEEFSDPMWGAVRNELNVYKRSNGGSGAGFFEYKAAEMEKELKAMRDEEGGDWKIPKIRIVHVVSEEQRRRVLEGRKRFLRARRETEWMERKGGIEGQGEGESSRVARPDDEVVAPSRDWEVDAERG